MPENFTLSDVQTIMLQGELREVLKEAQDTFRQRDDIPLGQRIMGSFRIGRVLRSRGRFGKLWDAAWAEFLLSPEAAEIGDGTLLEKFLEWLSNGGLEFLLDLLFRLIGGG